MDIREFTAEDSTTVGDVVELLNAAAKVDSPWAHPETRTTLGGRLRHGWDGERPRSFALRTAGRLAGAGQLWASDWDNRHLAWLELYVHPDARRRGVGSALLDFLVDRSREAGRRTVGTSGWDGPAARGFAGHSGLARKSAEVNRRQYVDEARWLEVERLRDQAAEVAAGYQLVRVFGRTPPSMLDSVAAMTAAINDAPTDELDVEDEVFPPERIVGYETAMLARGNRLYRVLARHRETGELAGHTVVAVETERPEIGDQHDTSVVHAHRGHRLGLLLKADMLLWLADAEPRLRTIDTWNAESNGQMIAVNERLGYRVMGRALAFQCDVQ